MKVYYHKSCMDGAAAAYIASFCYHDAELIPVQYGDPAPDVTSQDVLIVDFSWPREDMLRMIEQSESLECFDHHKTAKEALQGIPECVFDMNKSGARLVWEAHFPDTPSPWWLDYSEDRDLWLWKLPDSKAINAAMRSYGLTLEAMREIAQMDVADLIAPGEAILRYQRGVIDSHVGHAEPTSFGEIQALQVNATSLFSEIAGELAKRAPVGVTYFDKPGERVYQLRSVAPDGPDVGAIATIRGGGGHKHAAGFTVGGGAA